MTEERCEPPPELRGVDGWHHVNVAGIDRPVWWTASAIIPPNADYMEFAPAWIAPGGGRVGPLVAYHRKWRYIAPVATPAEVDALRAERDKLRTANTAYRFMLSNAKDKCTTLRARVAELEDALRCADQFITNGIELGYIRMPSPGTPDAAHRTPGIVRAAMEGKP